MFEDNREWRSGWRLCPRVLLVQRLTSGSEPLMFHPMNATLTSADRQLLKQLLKESLE